MKLPSRTVPDLASQLNFEKLERTVDSEPVTSLPTTDLYVGRRIVYVADAANGVYWDLVLTDPNATYPWKYVGGPALVSPGGVGLAFTTVGAAFSIQVVAGRPTLAFPLSGEYRTMNNGGVYHTTAGGYEHQLKSRITRGGALNQGDAFDGGSFANGAFEREHITHPFCLTYGPVQAGDVLEQTYAHSAGAIGVDWSNIYVGVEPVRVG